MITSPPISKHSGKLSILLHAEAMQNRNGGMQGVAKAIESGRRTSHVTCIADIGCEQELRSSHGHQHGHRLPVPGWRLLQVQSEQVVNCHAGVEHVASAACEPK
jgi:hypothetical protein